MDYPYDMTKKPPTGVLERALIILECFTQANPRLGLKDVADLSALDKSTALRALRTLVDYGYLIRHADGSYSPGPSNLRLASLFRSSSNTISRLEQPITNICRQVGATTSFFVRSNEDRMCLVRDHVHTNFRYFIEVGASVPLSQGGAAARVLKAYTERGLEDAVSSGVIRRGYYISRGERHKHFVSIGIPLFESDRTFLGAITITGMSVDLTDDDLRSFFDKVCKEMRSAGFWAGFPPT